MRLLSIHIKYGHWKEALVTAWRRDGGGVAVSRCQGSGLASEDSEHARAVRLLRVLRGMCKAQHDAGPADDKAWVASVGKHVTHCTGPLAICIALGVVKKLGKVDKAKRRRSAASRRPVASRRFGVLRLGVYGNTYRLSSLLEGVVAVKRLRTWVALADRIGAMAAPRTCRQWISAYKRMHDIMYETQPRHIKPLRRYIASEIILSYAHSHLNLGGWSVCVCV